MTDFPSIVNTALLIIFGVSVWVWHVRRHPWVNCGKCSGSGKRRTSILSDRFGNCPACGGGKKKLRLSARLAGYDLDTGRKKR